MKDTNAPSDTPPSEVPATSPPRMSAPGIKAVQGMYDAGPESQPDVQAIQKISPRDEVATGVPPLTPAAANDLELAAQRADASKATHYHSETEGGRIAEYQRLRSEISEELAVKNMPDGIRADAFSDGGTNFPNYDAFSPEEAASVKVYTLKDGKPRFGQYREVFSDLVDPDSGRNQKAAAQLMEIKSEDPARWEQLSGHLPEGVQAAGTQEQMQAGLADKATLRIPADQVDPVRADLRKYIAEHPEKYHLDSNPDPSERAAEIERMVQTKILAIDDRFTTAHYQDKAASLSGLRELMVERKMMRG